MPKKILLAEDSVTMQEVVQMTLAAEDFTVTVVGSVDEALARAKEIDPDLVLADLSMLVKNAYDLSKELKDAGLTAPVLALHGSAAPYDAAKGASAGLAAALAKPFDSQALIDKVIELTGAVPHKEARAPIQSLAPPIGADIAIEAVSLADAAPKPAPPTPAAAPKPAPPKPAPPKPAPPPEPAGAAKPAAAPKPAPPPEPAVAAKPAAAPRPAPPKPPAMPKAAPLTPEVPAEAPSPAPPPAPAAAPQQPAAVAAEPTEITIEAEPPPPSAASERLPSFDMPIQAPAAQLAPAVAAALDVVVAPGRPDRPGATLLGMRPPEGLPTPPPGMPLPPEPESEPVAVAAPVPTPAALAEIGELRAEMAQLQQRVVDIDRELKRLAAAAPAAAAPDGGGVDPAVQKKVLEKVIWEVVPELAEAMIREELDRLVETRGK